MNDLELGNCSIHDDRVKHFYCARCKTVTCRVCTESHHGFEDPSKQKCLIVDLYDLDDIYEFIRQVYDLHIGSETEEKNVSDYEQLNIQDL